MKLFWTAVIVHIVHIVRIVLVCVCDNLSRISKMLHSFNSEDSNILSADWSDEDRMELLTCRPVKDGKRLQLSNEVFYFLYYAENISGPVGKIFYFDVNERNRSCEFGYSINPKFRNNGYGKRMLSEFIRHMFSKTNFNKLYCQTASFNEPSVKMLERLGFKRDAVLREHHELDGKLYDDYVYSILRSES